MRKASGLFLIIVSLAALCIVSPTSAGAEERLLVVPTDYPTINEAIANATDGDTIFVKKGVYNETLCINKALNLVGENKTETIINGNTTGTVIAILHDNVNVTGFTVQYSAVPNVPRSYFQHDLPTGWPPTWREWTALDMPKDSGFFIRYGAFRLAGIHLLEADNCTVINNIVRDCGMGLWLYKATQNSIAGNIFVKNDYGLWVQESKYNAFFANTFANGSGGVELDDSFNNTFSQNSFVGNSQAVQKQWLTREPKNIWSNGQVGNYWSDYNGSDSNGDGLGDEPYQIMGEHYTGGKRQYGEWVTEVYGIDNYPLMQPFDASILNLPDWTKIHPKELSAPDATAPFPAAPIAVVVVLVTIGAFLFIFKRRRWF